MRFRFYLYGCLLFCGALVSAGGVQALTITGVRTGLHPDSTRVVLALDGKTDFRVFVLPNPWRLVVDLPDFSWHAGALSRPPGSLITGLRQGHLQDGVSRIIFALRKPVVVQAAFLMPARDGQTPRLVIDFAGADEAAAAAHRDHVFGSLKATAEKTMTSSESEASPEAPARTPPASSHPDTLGTLVHHSGPSEDERTADDGKPEAGTAMPPPPMDAVADEQTNQKASQSQSPSPSRAARGSPPLPEGRGDIDGRASSLSLQGEGRGEGQAVAHKNNGNDSDAGNDSGSGAEKNTDETFAVAPARKSLATPYTANPALKPLIIIDPGHGGVDPGTRGGSGVLEKNITLVNAEVVAHELQASGRYRVLLTRNSDVYLKLYERVAFARAHKGDLFISLHADSSPLGPGATGASIYTLSDTASDAETDKLAARENRADMIAGVDLSHQDDDVANILVDLAMRDVMNQSRFFSNMVAGNMHTNSIRTLERPQRAAGFAVLKDPDVPSILVEMGFLSNPGEAQTLCSPAFQHRLAQTLLASLDAYFSKIPTPGHT